MKKIWIHLLLICLYSFPFVYFAMYQDFINHSMLGYLLMLFVTSGLAFFGKLNGNVLAIIIGNIVSAIVSFYFIYNMQGHEGWDGYFKPPSPNLLLLSVSFLNLLPQIFVILIVKKGNTKD